jgi:hypothetical protein
MTQYLLGGRSNLRLAKTHPLIIRTLSKVYDDHISVMDEFGLPRIQSIHRRSKFESIVHTGVAASMGYGKISINIDKYNSELRSWNLGYYTPLLKQVKELYDGVDFNVYDDYVAYNLNVGQLMKHTFPFLEDKYFPDYPESMGTADLYKLDYLNNSFKIDHYKGLLGTFTKELSSKNITKTSELTSQQTEKLLHLRAKLDSARETLAREIRQIDYAADSGDTVTNFLMTGERPFTVSSFYKTHELRISSDINHEIGHQFHQQLGVLGTNLRNRKPILESFLKWDSDYIGNESRYVPFNISEYPDGKGEDLTEWFAESFSYYQTAVKGRRTHPVRKIPDADNITDDMPIGHPEYVLDPLFFIILEESKKYSARVNKLYNENPNNISAFETEDYNFIQSLLKRQKELKERDGNVD